LYVRFEIAALKASKMTKKLLRFKGKNANFCFALWPVHQI